MHSNTAFPHSCSIVSAIFLRMWNNYCVKEGGRGEAFYSQGPFRLSSSVFLSISSIHVWNVFGGFKPPRVICLLTSLFISLAFFSRPPAAVWSSPASTS